MLTDFCEPDDYRLWLEGITHTHRRDIHVRVLDLNHRRVGWIDNVIDGQVTIDVENRPTSRIANLTFADPSKSIGWEPDSPTSLPKHLRRMVQIFDVRYIPGASEPISCPVFCGQVSEFDRSGGEVSIVALGKESLASGSFGHVEGWKKGRKVTEVISEMLQLSGEKTSRIHLPDLAATLQADFNVSRTDKPLVKARKLAHDHDCVLYPNGRGHWVMRRKPTHSTLTVDRDWLTSPVQIDRPPLEYFNRWVVKGKKPAGNKTQPVADVWLPRQNPYSALHPDLLRNGKPHWLIDEIDRPNAETKAACLAIANRLRDAKIRFPSDISFDCLPFPNVEEWDLIKARDRFAGTATVQVKQATIPLAAGSQSIGALKPLCRVNGHRGFFPANHGGL
jgi:hypothetical protein